MHNSVLDLKMVDNDADAKTIRDYLISLLVIFWDDPQGFSGKRPFGNSDWEFELYKTLANHKIISDDFAGGFY